MKEMLSKLKADGKKYLDKFAETGQLPFVREREVLFVFHDPSGHVTEVRLVHHIYALDRAPKFERLGKDNLFALHLVLPPQARVEYTFGITYRDGGTKIVHDPLNTKKAWCPFGPKSVVNTEYYFDPVWAAKRTEQIGGTLTEHTLDSKVMGDSRFFQVYTPPEMDTQKKHSVIVIHDGSDYMNFSFIINVLDNLIIDKKIEPLIAVLSDPVNRNKEYSCTPEHALFVAEELLPFVHKNYPACTDRLRTCFMGASFGAVASLYASHCFPEKVGKLLLQSGSFRFQDLVKTSPIFDPIDEFDRITHFLEQDYFPKGPQETMKFFLSCGTFESLIGYNRLITEKLRNLGHSIQFRESNDGHNWISWRDRLKEGLEFLFPLDSESQ